MRFSKNKSWKSLKNLFFKRFDGEVPLTESNNSFKMSCASTRSTLGPITSKGTQGDGRNDGTKVVVAQTND